MPHAGDSTLASIEFSLSWTSADASHLDRTHGNKVNLWRDTFPGDLRARLEGLGPGGEASVSLPAGRGLEPRAAHLALDVPPAAFSGLAFARKAATGQAFTPRLGRFYPRGRVRGLPGVFDVDDLRPLRVLSRREKALGLDLNHPLAGRDLLFSARVLELRPKPGDTGGTAHHWLEEACADGPGMQAALPGLATEFAEPEAFARPDEARDTEFYARPRLVDHLDGLALEGLRDMYAARLAPGMAVLDLMASHDSHLPGRDTHPGLDVTGLGLNAEELAANPRLATRLVRDLNADPRLPLADASFDAVLLSLSVEYLTRPGAVLDEAARVLRPGGRLLVSFSDRYFPTKAVRLWKELHPFERLGLALGWFRETGRLGGLATETLRHRPRPAEDPHAREIRYSDPLFLAEARRLP